MDVKNNFALKKKQELLGSLNKRKMSLRKYIDNLKQNECRLDITQITKCVFLGSLCLKPVPQLFDSPLLLQELDMKVGNTESAVPINDENASKFVETINSEKLIRKEKGIVKKKCLNTPKIKKKSLREKNESKNVYNSLNNVKSENIKLEVNESAKLEDVNASLSANKSKEFNKVESPSKVHGNNFIAQKEESFVIPKLIEITLDETIEIEKSPEIPTDINFEGEIINLQLLTENDLTQQVDPDTQEPNSITAVEGGSDGSTPFENDERIKKETTPELLLSDPDDDTIDQLMYNIMDIKIGPTVFAKNFFDMSASDIESYSNEFNDKVDPPDTNADDPPPKDKKVMKRTPQCKICSQVFPSYIKLKKHKMTHNGDKPYHCLKCGENHTTLEQLIAHLRTHQGKRPYVCKKCNKGFKTTKALENHQPVHVLKKVVPPKKTFRCEVCLKEFRKLCDLERHTRVHTGEKPSVCNICNRRFQQAHNLNKHLLIHTQEKPFQCDICNKKFGRNDVLNRHLLTHSVKKPNHCETCMKSFIRVSQLLAHKEKYHPKKSS